MAKTIGLSVSVQDMDQVQEWAERMCADFRKLHDENIRLTKIRDAVYDWWNARYPSDRIHAPVLSVTEGALLDAIVEYDDCKG